MSQVVALVSYVINLDGTIVQHIEYVPFGEVFIEERNNTWNSPYLFNGKELDEETGLYYYGARYYNPRESVWLSTDPLAEKYPNVSPYAYTFNNPVKYTDPTGMAPDHEWELSHDKNGNEVKNKISDLGGDQVDFVHHMDGRNAGKTEVTANQGNHGSVWIESSAMRGYQSRNSNHVSPEILFSEWWNGTGYEKSLFLEPDINYADCGKSGSCGKKQSFIFDIGSADSKIGYGFRKAYLGGEGNLWLDWGVLDIPTENGLWGQMIGSSWGTMKKFPNSSLVMYMIQDTKTRNSLYLHATNPLSKILPKSVADFIGASPLNRVKGQRTPEGKTYQTYIWFEWQSTSRSKVNQYERNH